MIILVIWNIILTVAVVFQSLQIQSISRDTEILNEINGQED